MEKLFRRALFLLDEISDSKDIAKYHYNINSSICPFEQAVKQCVRKDSFRWIRISYQTVGMPSDLQIYRRMRMFPMSELTLLNEAHLGRADDEVNDAFKQFMNKCRHFLRNGDAISFMPLFSDAISHRFYYQGDSFRYKECPGVKSLNNYPPSYFLKLKGLPKERTIDTAGLVIKNVSSCLYQLSPVVDIDEKIPHDLHGIIKEYVNPNWNIMSDLPLSLIKEMMKQGELTVFLLADLEPGDFSHSNDCNDVKLRLSNRITLTPVNKKPTLLRRLLPGLFSPLLPITLQVRDPQRIFIPDWRLSITWEKDHWRALQAKSLSSSQLKICENFNIEITENN